MVVLYRSVIVVGLPALRQRGLFLAVTSLGFSLATTSYFLNRSFWVGSWGISVF